MRLVTGLSSRLCEWFWVLTGRDLWPCWIRKWILIGWSATRKREGKGRQDRITSRWQKRCWNIEKELKTEEDKTDVRGIKGKNSILCFQKSNYFPDIPELRCPRHLSCCSRVLSSWGCDAERAHSSRTAGALLSHETVWIRHHNTKWWALSISKTVVLSQTAALALAISIWPSRALVSKCSLENFNQAIHFFNLENSKCVMDHTWNSHLKIFFFFFYWTLIKWYIKHYKMYQKVKCKKNKKLAMCQKAFQTF